jgi:hypothetical protein
MTMNTNFKTAVFGIALLALGALSGCEKKQKKVTAGGGASTQAIFTIRGAGQ